jgi:hypothetical protein
MVKKTRGNLFLNTENVFLDVDDHKKSSSFCKNLMCEHIMLGCTPIFFPKFEDILKYVF